MVSVLGCPVKVLEKVMPKINKNLFFFLEGKRVNLFFLRIESNSLGEKGEVRDLELKHFCVFFSRVLFSLTFSLFVFSKERRVNT